VAEEVPDIVMKKGDTAEPLRARLKRKNPDTGEWEPIDLSVAQHVKVIIKGRRGGTITHDCTGWGGTPITSSTGPAAGQVEYSWAQSDLLPSVTPELYDMEWEIEYLETGGVKREQTVPNKIYKLLEVKADLGGVVG